MERDAIQRRMQPNKTGEQKMTAEETKAYKKALLNRGATRPPKYEKNA